MLGKTWRLICKNASGVAMGASDTVTAQVTRWKVGTDGSRTAETTAVNVFGGTAGNSLANNGFVAGTTQDNAAASTFWFGGEITFSATVSTATPNGNIELYYQTSHDGGTTWPDNGLGELLDTLNFTATGTKRTSLEI